MDCANEKFLENDETANEINYKNDERQSTNENKQNETLNVDRQDHIGCVDSNELNYEHDEININVFKQNEMNCNQTTNNNNNIIHNCQHLQRLSFALKYYNKSNKSVVEWSNFCLTVYGVKLLDDYCHLLAKHSNELDEIQRELVEKYGFANCLIKDCKFSHRHFNDNRRDIKYKRNKNEMNINFYQQEYDSLHFNLFHLFEIGYRFKKKEKENNNLNI